ncbi:Uncharacterised protein [Streptococcus pneumoniae]|nr:Uncharacterised protein [Streptococcus pneumoniae]CJM49302.1 Uncharacterised protein [Streptococcus pneumoniae]
MRILRIALEFLIENLRVCLTETIDGLLDISHHKAIVAIRQQFQHPFLNMVGILILIDHDFMEALLIRLTNLWEIF